eukprot:2555182-Rhodomonas_salina.1
MKYLREVDGKALSARCQCPMDSAEIHRPLCSNSLPLPQALVVVTQAEARAVSSQAASLDSVVSGTAIAYT